MRRDTIVLRFVNASGSSGEILASMDLVRFSVPQFFFFTLKKKRLTLERVEIAIPLNPSRVFRFY